MRKIWKKQLALLLVLLLTVFLTAGCTFGQETDLTDLVNDLNDLIVEEQEALEGGDIEEDWESLFGEEETDPEEDPTEEEQTAVEETEAGEEALLPEDGVYSSKEDVALYIHQYGHLPDNFITKKEAEALGWPGGSLEKYAPGMCIGGSRFGNYEGLLPAKKGRTYTECDIDTLGASSRGAKRIVFSNDGLIYYTDDHYKSFTLLYGGDE